MKRKTVQRFPVWMILLLIFLVLSGCSVMPRESTQKDPRTKGEERHSPLGFPQDQEIVTEREPLKKQTQSESKTDQKIKAKELEEGKAIFPRIVYRVQFFATQYPDEASKVSDLVKNQLSENTYIDYKTPYYWVRVGDCVTKEEAESLLEKIRNLGYPQSWVVEVKTEP
ncbi:MAG: SPOR domain-containing protein [Candidatus Zixiibacteriota bacterium]